MPTAAREIHLASRPHGEPVPSDFRMETVTLADPRPGQVLVRTLAMSVDPYMRGRMNDLPSYVPAWELGAALDGSAVGQVVAAGAGAPAPGTLVAHELGWRDHALLEAGQVTVLPDLDGLSSSVHLGILGIPGLTAYAGLFDVARFQAGDTVFVSGAAGAVGGLVGQFARLRGAARVIGSAGSPAKVRYLVEELGYDGAFDYHDGPVRKQLRAAAPDGIDVYFDNVGGEHLEAAIGALRLHGRVAMCGAISGYNATERPTGPGNLAVAIGRRLTLRGFIVHDHEALRPEFLETAGAWLRSGELVSRETVVEGLDSAVAAFIGMLRGENTGKMVVRLGADPA